MAATQSPKPRALRRSWLPAEKRRIVELTLHVGVGPCEHGVHLNSLHQWRMLYRTGKLEAPVRPVPPIAGPAASATFVPESLVSEVRRSQPAARPDAAAGRSGIVHLMLASGATLRIEMVALDAALVCALVAELRR